MNSPSLARKAVARSLQRFKLPPRMTISEWADQHRYLSSESSAEAGRWYTARAEYQREMMDALCDPNVHTVVLMTSAQIGKSSMIENALGFFIDKDPSPILVVQPTVEMGMAWSKERLSPMLRDCPVLRGKVQDPRTRDSGNTVARKEFEGGYVSIVGSNSPAGLSSRPIRVLLCDEIDRWPMSAGSEGDPLRLAFKRNNNYWNKKRLVVSTPTVKGFSRIERMYEESDKRRFWVPCPHCGEYQTLIWGQVQWPEDHPELAAYFCGHCAAEIDDADKLSMVRGGEWRSECAPAVKGTVGFHLNELYSPWRSFGEIAVDFIAAKRGGSEQLRTWVNLSLGETWEESGEQVEAAPLYHRREQMQKLPEGVALLTAGIDIQADRAEVSIIGWGSEEESWIFAHRQIFGDPATPQLWAELDHLLQQRFEHAAGVQLQIVAACIDSGHATDAVYHYCRTRYSRRIYAIKGMPGEGRALMSRPIKSSTAKVPLFTVGVDTAKDTIYSRLKIAEEGPGYVHFSADLDEEFFKQLTAESIKTRYVKGRPIREWQKIRSRNEGLDCAVYALAALRTLNVNLAQLATQLRPKPKNEPPAPKPPPRTNFATSFRKSSRGNFATSWR